MSRGRILVVKPIVPYPPDQGTKVVSFAMVEALSAEYDVTILTRVLDANDERAARELEERGVRVVAVWPVNRRRATARVAYRLAYTARSLATGRSLKSLYDCPGAFVRAARALAREPFDLVVLEYWQLYPLLEVFDRERTVLLTHDIDLLVNRNRALLEPRLLARAAALRRWRIEQREEVRAYQRARWIWALTRRDADAARRLSRGHAAVDVLPFGLPAERFADPLAARESRDVLFLGAMRAAFNRDALDYFARHIHPLLATIDRVHFTVVGGALPRGLEFLGALRNVEVAGHTRDVRPYFDRAACLVVPLRYGGGLRVRIIEAMAAGLPVVASPVAVEGLDVEPGRDVLVAETPAAYRAHVERLVGDPGFALGLARAGREQAWRVYGPVARTEGILAAAGRLVREEEARPEGP